MAQRIFARVGGVPLVPIRVMLPVKVSVRHDWNRSRLRGLEQSEAFGVVTTWRQRENAVKQHLNVFKGRHLPRSFGVGVSIPLVRHCREDGQLFRPPLIIYYLCQLLPVVIGGLAEDRVEG